MIEESGLPIGKYGFNYEGGCEPNCPKCAKAIKKAFRAGVKEHMEGERCEFIYTIKSFECRDCGQTGGISVGIDGLFDQQDLQDLASKKKFRDKKRIPGYFLRRQYRKIGFKGPEKTEPK